MKTVISGSIKDAFKDEKYDFKSIFKCQMLGYLLAAAMLIND